jgi:pimeloyl-ACP methyl ester carboxylesterase
MRYLCCGPKALPASSTRSLIFLHGLLGYSFSWRFNLPVFAERARVYAPDMLGTGFSERPASLACGIRASARRILEFMDLVGIDTADVIATSHGGAVAAFLTALAPARIARLVLAAPVNPWSAHGQQLTAILGTRLGAASLKALAPLLSPLHSYFLGRMYGDPRRIAPDTVEGYAEPLAIPGTIRYLSGVMAFWRSDLEQLAGIYKQIADKPTLLVWGDRDGAVLPASATELQNQLRCSKLVVLPGVGHLPYEEAPEEFNRVVLEFLHQQEISPPAHRHAEME